MLLIYMRKIPEKEPSAIEVQHPHPFGMKDRRQLKKKPLDKGRGPKLIPDRLSHRDHEASRPKYPVKLNEQNAMAEGRSQVLKQS